MERVLPEDGYRALQDEIKRQQAEMPPASGLGLDQLNTIPANYEDALKKVMTLMDRTLRWRRLCFLYEMAEQEAAKQGRDLAKRNAEFE